MQNTKQNEIAIEAELTVPLGELALYVLKKEEDVSTLVNILDNRPEVANKELERICREDLPELQDNSVTVEKVEYDYVDSSNLDFGVAYFKITLTGTFEALKKLAGMHDELFGFDWNNYRSSKLSA